VNQNLFHNKHKIQSNRLKNYDYSSNWWYFITICTKNREYYFGDVKNDKMVLNKIGEIVQKYILEIPNHFDFVLLDQYVVMPNHIHIVLIIDNRCSRDAIYRICENIDTMNRVSTETNRIYENIDTMNRVSTETNRICENIDTINRVSTEKINKNKLKWWFMGDKNVMFSNSIWKIIRRYKWICSFYINKTQLGDFARQSNYYDHIIRNEE